MERMGLAYDEGRSPPRPVTAWVASEFQIVKALHVLERIEFEPLGSLQPERRAGVRTEMPAHDLAHLCIEFLARGCQLTRRNLY